MLFERGGDCKSLGGYNSGRGRSPFPEKAEVGRSEGCIIHGVCWSFDIARPPPPNNRWRTKFHPAGDINFCIKVYEFRSIIRYDSIKIHFTPWRWKRGREKERRVDGWEVRIRVDETLRLIDLDATFWANGIFDDDLFLTKYACFFFSFLCLFRFFEMKST